MKKITLLFICCLSVLSISAEVYSGSCGTNVRYSLDTSTGLLSITGTGSMSNYSNPYYAGWYSNKEYVKTVEISDGVTSIGETAFYNCSKLTSVTIPNSVTSIGEYAFRGCSGLTSVTIPNSVTSIGRYAFRDCSSLTSVTIPNSVTSIGSSTFSGCSGLTTVTIPNSVTSIEDYAFSGCSGLTSVTIPNSVTSIGSGAFSGCSGLTSVTIPNSVTSIGSGAFRDCSGLTSISVESGNEKYDSRNNCNAIKETASNTLIAGCKNTTIPNSVTSIGDYAFSGCSGLTSVTIPNSVTSIGEYAFRGCSGLTSVTIPNSVTSIGSWAFDGCSKLTSVTIGKSVTRIGGVGAAFSGCSGLTKVTLNSNAIASKSYSSDYTYHYTLGGIFGNQVKEYVLGDDVTSIGGNAFYDCSGLTSVTIGNSVTSIGSQAFYGCSGLTSIEIPNSVTSIGGYAFSGTAWYNNQPEGLVYAGLVAYKYKGSMPANTSITIKEGTLGIGNDAFEGYSGLTSVTIPNSVTSIGNRAFYGCSGLKSVKSDILVPFTFGSNAFNGISSNCVLAVPYKTKDAYIAKGWTQSVFKGGIKEIMPIVDGIYYDFNSDTKQATVASGEKKYSGNVIIPSSVTFNDTEYSVTSIGQSAFDGCSSLSSITIPNSVTSIGSSAFSGCSGLTAVHITDIAAWCKISFSNYDANPLSNAKHLFMDGKEITDLVIPNSVTSIGDYAFRGCSGLTSVTIPNSVTSIGDYAFQNCSGLTSVTIPNSVTSIGSGAFNGTAWYNNQPNGLVYAGLVAYKYKGTMPENTEVTLKEGTLGIADYAFYGCSGLTSINIPDGVTSIGRCAFYNCSGLTSVKIPNSVTSIGESAFSGCTNLTKVELNSNAVASKSYSFTSSLNNVFGTQVKEYILGNDVKSIGSYAFYDCSGLTSVTIPNSVTSIGESAFEDCHGLTSIEIPNSVTSIGNSAFYGCSGLTSVICKATSVPSTGSAVFYNVPQSSATLYVPNSALENYKTTTPWNDFGNIKPFDFINGSCGENVNFILNLETGILSITGTGAMTDYSSKEQVPWYEDRSVIKSVVIDNGVTSIGSYAFYGTNLKTLIVGTGMLSFSTNAFSTSPAKTIWLTNTPPQNYTVAQGTVNYVANSQYSSLNNMKEYKFLSSMFEVDGVRYVPVSPSERTCDAIDCVYNESITEVSINPTVSYRNINMKVQNVQPYTFYQYTNIKKVSLDIDGSIGKYVFSGCNNLQTVVLGENITGIGDYAFNSCSKLNSIIIPDSVTSIGQYAFSGCTEMKSVVIGDGTNTIGNNAFSGCSSLSSVTIGKGANSIGNYAFSGCNSLASISLGEGTETINQYAFQNCSSLTSITIPGSVNSIGNYAFNGCKGLKTVIMANRQTGGDLKLGYNGNSPLFVDCPLDSVYIGRNISYSTGSSYGYSPFYRNTSLRTVVITDKETDISENEFYGCTNLQNVQIGDGVTAIGNWAFSGCSSLKNFSFGTHVKTIGKEAFSDCTAVTAITSKAQTPPTCGAQALDDINKWDCVLYVPEGYASSYQNADQWKEFFFIEEKKFDLRGDANGDGKVNMDDATFVTNIILGTEDATEAADVNKDGEINMPDAMFIVNKILNGKFPDE